MLNEYNERIDKMLEELNNDLETLKANYEENKKVIDSTKPTEQYVEPYNYMTDELLKEQKILDEIEQTKQEIAKTNELRKELEKYVEQINHIDEQINYLQKEMQEETSEEIIDCYNKLIGLLENKKKGIMNNIENIIPMKEENNDYKK